MFNFADLQLSKLGESVADVFSKAGADLEKAADSALGLRGKSGGEGEREREKGAELLSLVPYQ